MTKLVLKCGDIDVEYEGPEEFLKEELPKLIKAVAELRSAGPARKQAPAGADTGGADTEASVSTLAQRLSVSNGPELIMAAALSLARGGVGSFTKKLLRDKIREAKTFYKATYSNNFDNYIAGLIKKGRLNHSGGNNYALPENEQTALEKKLSPL
jgi:hypothetical protein